MKVLEGWVGSLISEKPNQGIDLDDRTVITGGCSVEFL